MASHIQDATIKSKYSNPDISYKITYTATRTSNSSVTYDFTIKSYLVGTSNSQLGTGYVLTAYLAVGDSTEKKVVLKPKSSNWKGGSSSGTLKSTKTISITCSSDAADTQQEVSFKVDNFLEGVSNGTSGEVNTSNYYVISPALLYTNVSAPTNIKIGTKASLNDSLVNLTADKIITPATYINISWAPAKDGTNNAVKSYNIYYKRNGATTWTLLKSDITGTSYEFQYGTRKDSLIFGIKTIGEVAGYDSDTTTISHYSLIINSLPKAPVVTVTDTNAKYIDNTYIIPSNINSITIDINSESTDEDNQSLTVYYKDTSTEVSTKIKENSLQISLDSQGKTLTYEFYVSDGLENSNLVSITIKRNIKPKIEELELTKTDLFFDQTTYFINPTLTIKKANKEGLKYEYYLYYLDSTSPIKKFTKETDSLKILDIREEVDSIFSKSFYFVVIPKDEVENGEKWTSDTYKFPSYPYLINSFNGENGNIPNSNPKHFYQYLEFDFCRDQGYRVPTWLFLKTKNNNSINIQLSENNYSINDNSIKLKIDLSNKGLEHGTEFEFQVSMKRINSEKTDTFDIVTSSGERKKYQKVPMPNKDGINPSFDQATFNFYTTTNGSALTITKFFTDSLPYSDYSLSETESFFLQLGTNGSKKSINNYIGQGPDNSTLQFNIPANDFRELIPNESNKNKNYFYSLIFKIVNAFGITIELEVKINQNSQDFQIIYLENPVGSNVKLQTGSNKILIDLKSSEIILKEGMSIYCNGDFTSFNGDITGQLQIKQANTSIWQNFAEPFIIEVTNPSQEQGDWTPGQAAIEKKLVGTLGEFKNTETLDYNFRLLYWVEGGEQRVIELSTNSIMGHTNASLELNSQYNNGTYSFKHICKSLGINPSLSNEKIDNITVTNKITFNSNFIFTIPKINGTVINKAYNTTLNDFIKDSNEGNEKSFKPEFNNTTWQTGSVILVIETIHTKTITQGQNSLEYITTYTTNSNENTIYNLIPTISYRKNALGINVFDPDRDTILTIGEAQGRAKIKYEPLEDGKCCIINFQIDCGSW